MLLQLAYSTYVHLVLKAICSQAQLFVCHAYLSGCLVQASSVGHSWLLVPVGFLLLR